MTPATRRAAFAADEGIEAGAGVRMRAAEHTRILRGPELRCAQTCERMGLEAEVDDGLRDWDLGSWRGSTLAEVAAGEPDGVEAWLADPASTPHGGEPLVALLARTAAWLDGLGDGPLVAVAHPALARAAVLHAVRADPAAFWRLDVAPGTVTSLSGRSQRWNVSRFGAPLLLS